MKHQEYMIGDVAAITGISRDALRFYEKKGILTSRKKPNGYRYFTEDDLYRLVRILFSRRLNFDIDTIGELLDSTPLSSDYQDTLHEKVKEELEIISRHKQALSRLLSMKKIYKDMKSHLNVLSMAPFPVSHLLCTLSSPSEGLRQWFSLSQEYPELDMAYLYDCYRYESGFSLTETEASDDSGGCSPGSYEARLLYQNTLLVLYEDVMDILKTDHNFSHCDQVSYPFCIHTITEDCSLEPRISLITSMRQWAAGQGLIPSSRVLVTANFSRIQQDSAIYSQEIYIPLLSP